ncbi:MAG: MFS transporter, partial [Chlamydiota bacterium]
MSPFSRDRLAGLIGNVLEHYDHALFALLAPFIAPLFFQNQDPLTALILTYGILPLGLLTKPLGSLFFGWIGDRIGRREALFYSLFGMAMVTVGMGSLPLYAQAGIWAPVLLSLGKMLQSFFAAGESTGGAIFVLEQTPLSKRTLLSSFYGASTMIGILIASGWVALLGSQGSLEKGWRFLFWAGGLTAFIGAFLRLGPKEKVAA